MPKRLDRISPTRSPKSSIADPKSTTLLKISTPARGRIAFQFSAIRAALSWVFVIALIGSLLGAGPVAGPFDASASAAGRPTASVSLATSANSVVLGRSVKLTGRVRLAGHNVATAVVTVVGKSALETTWHTLGTTRTSKSGRFSFNFTPAVGYSIRAKIAATKRYASRASIIRRLAVAPAITALSPTGASVALPTRAKFFSGKVSSALAGGRVTLERMAGSAWSTIASSTFDSSGRFVLSTTVDKPGEYKYRVRVPAAAGLSAYTSGTRVVTYVRNSAVLRDTEACYGAKFVKTSPCVNSRLDGLLLPTTEPVALEKESGGGFACWTQDTTAFVETCSYGSTRADAFRIALVGDSHAASYLPALRDQLSPNNWRLDSYLGKSCRWMELPETDRCNPRAADIQNRILAGGYDLVIYTGMRQLAGSQPSDVYRQEAQEIADRYSAIWEPVIASGVPVFAIADSGISRDFSCVVNATAAAAANCWEPKSSMYRGIDPLPIAVGETAGARLIDMNDFFCIKDRCPLVRGNVLVYRDSHHLTGMFAETLGPYLAARIVKELGR